MGAPISPAWDVSPGDRKKATPRWEEEGLPFAQKRMASELRSAPKERGGGRSGAVPLCPWGLRRVAHPGHRFRYHDGEGAAGHGADGPGFSSPGRWGLDVLDGSPARERSAFRTSLREGASRTGGNELRVYLRSGVRDLLPGSPRLAGVPQGGGERLLRGNLRPRENF